MDRSVDRQSVIPLYHQLKEILKDKIEKGKFREGNLIPSEREICEIYEVSRITARQAILDLVNDGLLYREGGRGTFVASKTEKKLTIALVALGYSNESYRTRSNTFYDLVRGIAQTSLEKQVTVNLLFPEVYVDSNSFLQRIVAKKLDGVLIKTRLNIEYQDVKMLEEANLPYVVIKRHIPGRDINCVISDDVKGAFQATKHLISLGHRRIGLITGMPDAIIIWQDRIKGYRKALEKHNIPFDDKLICENDNFLEEGGYQCMNELLGLKRGPTAVFVASDSMAIGAYKAIKKKGLKIPEDIAIVGYDDIELASTMLDPPLTTTRTSFFEFGKKSVELLLGIINKKHFAARKVIIEPVLVIRKSCGGKN